MPSPRTLISRLPFRPGRLPRVPTMAFLDTLPIRAKLAIGYGIVLGAMAISTVVATTLLWRISAANASAADASAALGRVITASEQALMIRSAVLEARLGNDPAQLAALPVQSAALRAAVDALAADAPKDLSDRVNAFLITASEAQPLLDSRQQLIDGLLEPSGESAFDALAGLAAARPSSSAAAALTAMGRARAAHAEFLRSGTPASLDAADAALKDAQTAVGEDAASAIDDYATALVLLRANQQDFERVVLQNLQREGGLLLEALWSLQSDMQAKGEAATGAAAGFARVAKFVSGALAVVGLVAGIAFAVAVRRRILASVATLSSALASVAADLDFDRRVDIVARDELGEAATNLNRLLASIGSAIDDVADRSAAIAAGDFSDGRTSRSAGGIGRLEASLDEARRSLSTSFQRIRDVNESLAAGRFEVRMDLDGLQGDFLSTVWAANLTAETFQRAISGIGQSVSSMAEGRFDQRIADGLPGELGGIAAAINGSLAALEAALDAVVGTAQALAEGDLTRPVEGRYHGRLTDLQAALNTSVAAVAQVLRSVDASAKEVDAAAKALSRGADELAGQAQQQAAFIEQTAASIEEVGASVARSAEEAAAGSRDAGEAGELAARGLDTAAKASLRIRQLERGSQQIGDVTRAIQGIAFQTNILALNAAVEAARAGEAGRGFAVVANEVRALAQRADEATGQIRQQIDVTRESVIDGLAEVEGTEASILALADRSRRVADAFAQVAGSADEQARGVAQINAAILELDRMGQRLALIVDETTAAATALAGVAAGLVDDVARFQLDPRAEAASAPMDAAA